MAGNKYPVFILFFLCALFSFQAQAFARCAFAETGSKEEAHRDQRLIDKAFFIGKVKIENIDVLEEKRPLYSPEIQELDEAKQETFVSGYRVTVSSIQPYKGKLDSPVTFNVEAGPEQVGSGKKGQIVERILFKDAKEKYGTTGWCSFLSETGWKNLREHAENSPQMNKLEQECSEKGGQLYIQTNPLKGDHPLQCLLPASDEGTPCVDNRQCEGLCIAELAREENWRVRYSGEELKTKGNCTKWQNKPGCYFIVYKGKVYDYTCTSGNF